MNMQIVKGPNGYPVPADLQDATAQGTRLIENG